MKEIYVGLKLNFTPAGEVDRERGFTYFGLEEVNACIVRGARVVSVEEGGMIMHKTGEREGHVDMGFSGFELKVVLEDVPVRKLGMLQ